MEKTVFTTALILGLLMIFGGTFIKPKPEGKENAPKTNVVFILVDTLRADRLHAVRNGIPVMPNLARLAKQGAEFSHAVAACNWTRPSVASILTGTYLDAHQVYYGVDQNDPLDKSEDFLSPRWLTLPEFLAGNGYDTFAFVTNGNVAFSLGFGQGFPPKHLKFGNNSPAGEVTKSARKALDTLKPPFFMYLHYIDPHVPYDPPKGVLEDFGPLPEIIPADKAIFDRFLDYYLDCAYTLLGMKAKGEFPEISEQGRERVLTLYDLECHYVDKQIGLLAEVVKTKYPDTVFVITADHGEEFWERGGMGHGTTLYEEQQHVPLLVFGPGIAPQVIAQTTENLGLAPTLAAYLHLEGLDIWQGRNWFSPPGTPQKTAFAHSLSGSKSRNFDQECAWMQQFKLMRNNKNGNLELYDLSTDPLEKNNLSTAQPDLVREGAAKLEEHREQNIKTRGADKVRVRGTIDPTMQEQLKKLGY